MKRFRGSVNRLQSPVQKPQQPKIVDASPYLSHTSSFLSHSPPPDYSKRPSITMLPRDSASSISKTQSRPSIRRKLTSRGPCCPKHPTLQEILAGTSDKPWTLDAFQAYCEQNLCVENLFFIQEADRYIQKHRAWIEGHSVLPPSPSSPPSDLPHPSATTATIILSPQNQDLVSHWKAMLAHYIATGGPQEVNLPGNVRDALLAVPDTSPPDPRLLYPAVSLTHRLIEDSILFPFLNDVRHDCVEENQLELFDSPVEESPRLDSPRYARSSGSASATIPVTNPNSYASGLFHMRSTRQPRSSSRPKSMFSVKDTSVLSGSTSLDAPRPDGLSPVTTRTPSTSHPSFRSPPASAPPSDCGVSNNNNQRSRSDSSSWRKLGARLGFSGKRVSNSQLRSVGIGESALSD